MINKSRHNLSKEWATALSRLASQGKSIFTVAEFASASNRSREQTWRVLYFLQKGGWIQRLFKGTYLIVPLEAGPGSAWTEDSLVIGCHLVSQAAVAYWSACRYWGWTEQIPNTVFIQTTQQKMHTTRMVLGVRYRFIRVLSRKFFAILKRRSSSNIFTITDREKTLVDALDHPELCGGIHQVMEMLSTAERIDWNRVENYLENIGSGAIYKRLGFLIEQLEHRVSFDFSKDRLARWRSILTGGYALLEPGSPAKGLTEPRWRIRINVPWI